MYLGYYVGVISSQKAPAVTPPGVDVATYYVNSAIGSDSNNGTSAATPFATIQKSSTLAVAGNVISIASGTYRETIVPTNSGSAGNPILYRPAPGATVVVSGLSAVADAAWTLDSGNVYKATVAMSGNLFSEADISASNTTILAQQVFCGGNMMILGRYPKIGDVTGYLEKGNCRNYTQTISYTGTQINDSVLGTLPGSPNLTGAYVWRNGWFLSETGQISAHSGSTITFPLHTTQNAQFYQFYYVCGHRGLVTTPKEWHYAANTLYLWAPDGNKPTNVEYKVRNWGFDLRSKSNITIQGLTFKGCDAVKTNTSSPNIIVDGILNEYGNHSFIVSSSTNNYNGQSLNSGIQLHGSGSVLKNSTVRYTATAACILNSGVTAQNNYMEYISYAGFWGAPFMAVNGSVGAQIINNTARKSGRGAVESRGGTITNLKIRYNDFSGHNKLLIDGGAFYSQINTNFPGLEIDHNWMHDPEVYGVGTITLAGVQVTGIYMDQASGPLLGHHNVVWGGQNDDFYAEPDNGTNNFGGRGYGHELINESLMSTGIYSSTQDRTAVTAAKTRMRNCRTAAAIILNGEVEDTSDASPGDVLFASRRSQTFTVVGTNIATQKGQYYIPASGNVGINAGTTYTSTAVGVNVTNGFLGAAPDIGAYEFGDPNPWTAGYTAVVTSGPAQLVIDDRTTGTGTNQLNYVGTGWDKTGTKSGPVNGTFSYTLTTGDYVEISWSGYKIDVISEKFPSHGIFQVSLDGVAVTTVDQYAAAGIDQQTLYSSPTLTEGIHTLRLTVTGNKNAASTNTYLVVDAFKVYYTIP